MAGSSEIAHQAIDLATGFLEKESRKIAEMADGDMEHLRAAAQIVLEHPKTESLASLSPEHVAFSLITAAYDLQRRDAGK